MKNKLPVLIFTSALLLGIALFMQSPPGHRDLSGSKLLKGIKLEEVNKIVMEKGNKKTTLLRSSNGYQLEEKEGYSADTAKADALLVELLNMRGTEWITSKKEKSENFGLSDSSQEALIITLLSENGSEAGGVIIGNTPKTEGDMQRGYAMTSSRYVRAKGKGDIFLVSKVTLQSASPSDWLSKDLLQLKGEDIESIEITHKNSNDSFKLKNKGNSEFEPDGFTIPAGKKLKTYAINGIGNALANLRLNDSLKKGNGAIKDLNFDSTFTATLKDGRKYELFSAKKEEEGRTKNYITISASFIASGKENKEENPAMATNPGEIAITDNQKFEGWIFEVSNINNFTYKKSDLFEDE